MTLQQLARSCGGETPQEVKDKFEFYTADNASDETAACRLLKDELKNLNYENPDTAHSIMLATKNGCRGDPEIELVQQIFLTSKRPYKSVAGILRHSTRCQSVYKEEQVEATFVTLGHLGWAPQRHDSAAHALGHSSLTIEQLLAMLGREIDQRSTYKDSAKYNLEMLEVSCRLSLAGMLADLMTEHQRAVRESDVMNPDPTQVSRSISAFRARAEFLFKDGNIMVAKGTYTAQIQQFLAQETVLMAGSRSYVFALPDRRHPSFFEPLERVRGVLGNILCCLEAALPPTSWQRSFAAFRLPHPLGPRSTACAEAKADARLQLRRILRQGGIQELGRAVAEVEELMPQAERHNREDGLDAVASWALASRDRPEKLLARGAVDKLLGCFHSTSNIERALKKASRRTHVSKGGLDMQNFNDYFLCDMCAPTAADVSQRVGGKIVPRGCYIDKILGAFTENYGKPRELLQAPKTRRDAGVRKDAAASDRKRRETNQQFTFAEFKRSREMSIQALEALPADELATKRQRIGVPDDTQKYVTDDMRSVREKAAKRGATKALRFLPPAQPAGAAPKAAPKAKAKAKPRARWAGRAAPKALAAGGGEIPPPGGETPDKICIYLPPRDTNEELFRRRGYEVQSKLWCVVRFALTAVVNRDRVIAVIPRLVDQAEKSDVTLNCCRVLGSFVTTLRWIEKAVRDKKPPAGFAYKGLVAKRARLGVSPALQAKMPEFADLLRVLDDDDRSNIAFEDSLADVLTAYTEVCAEGGVRSKPWLKVCWLCADSSDSAAVIAQNNLGEPRKRAVQPFYEYLRAASPVIRTRGCPGRWCM